MVADKAKKYEFQTVGKTYLSTISHHPLISDSNKKLTKNKKRRSAVLGGDIQQVRTERGASWEDFGFTRHKISCWREESLNLVMFMNVYETTGFIGTETYFLCVHGKLPICVL